jgi:hypothetical protein
MSPLPTDDRFPWHDRVASWKIKWNKRLREWEAKWLERRDRVGDELRWMMWSDRDQADEIDRQTGPGEIERMTSEGKM